MQIYDSLGLVRSIIIQAKILMKDLWMLGWNKSIPQEIYSEWMSFRSELEQLTVFKKPSISKKHKKYKIA